MRNASTYPNDRPFSIPSPSSFDGPMMPPQHRANISQPAHFSFAKSPDPTTSFDVHAYVAAVGQASRGESPRALRVPNLPSPCVPLDLLRHRVNSHLERSPAGRSRKISRSSESDKSGRPVLRGTRRISVEVSWPQWTRDFSTSRCGAPLEMTAVLRAVPDPSPRFASNKSPSPARRERGWGDGSCSLPQRWGRAGVGAARGSAPTRRPGGRRVPAFPAALRHIRGP
jgi:hypothetical protein